MLNSVSIIGLGWLGLPLALAFKNKYGSALNVIGTKTDSKGVASAKVSGIDALLFNTTLDFSLREKGVRTLFSSDMVIITLPPSAHHEPEKYPAIIKALVKTARYCGAKQLLFTSSISVYGIGSSLNQKESSIITEESSLNPIIASAKAIVEVEDFLLNHQPLPAIILRLGGLIGPYRHPITYLSGKELNNPYDGVYLIHQDDIIAAFLKVISSFPLTQKNVYNLVASETTTKINYYNKMAMLYNLPPPVIPKNLQEGVHSTTVISSKKFCQAYDFQFHQSIYKKMKLTR